MQGMAPIAIGWRQHKNAGNFCGIIGVRSPATVVFSWGRCRISSVCSLREGGAPSVLVVSKHSWLRILSYSPVSFRIRFLCKEQVEIVVSIDLWHPVSNIAFVHVMSWLMSLASITCTIINHDVATCNNDLNWPHANTTNSEDAENKGDHRQMLFLSQKNSFLPRSLHCTS